MIPKEVRPLHINKALHVKRNKVKKILCRKQNNNIS